MGLPDGVAFTGDGKLVRKAFGYEQEKAEAALSRIGFARCASRASAPIASLKRPEAPGSSRRGPVAGQISHSAFIRPSELRPFLNSGRQGILARCSAWHHLSA